MASEHERGSAPDPVVPPAPPAPGTQQPYQQPVIPPQRVYQQPNYPQQAPVQPAQPVYAPPVHGQPPYSQQAPYSPKPPYAQQQAPHAPQQPYAQQPYAQQPYAQQPPYVQAGYPASVAAPPPSTNRVGLILGIVGGAVALMIVGIVIITGFFAGSRPGPVPTVTTQPQAVPSADPAEETPIDEPIDDESDVDAGTDIALRLDAKINEYKNLRESGELWQSIPDNDFNRTAVSAFLYMLADMKAATIWGIDATKAKQYDERMTMLEEHLLAQQPLGTNIKLSFEDGRVFTYNGDTGEGGYTQE